MIFLEGTLAGYALVGSVRADPNDTITEYFLFPLYRRFALPVFQQLISVSSATKIEALSNDLLLSCMLYDTVHDINSTVILFHDAMTTHLPSQGWLFRKYTINDAGLLFDHHVEPVGDWLIEKEGVIAATGGFLCHYNPPFADIYMEVAKPHRYQGIGSYLVQELKRECYAAGKLPAARWNASNPASRATLQKAGMQPWARVLTGTINKAIA